MLRCWLLLVVAIVLVACGVAPPPPCVAGATHRCDCAGGGQGVQTCNAAGTGYGPCESCPGSDVVAPTDDGVPVDTGPICTPVACECGDDGCRHVCTSGCAPGYSCRNRVCIPPMICLPACGAGYRCVGTTCEVDPGAYWVITATSGTVSTAFSWDAGGGAPDPFVCITLNGARTCTPAANDSFFPTWNHPFPAAPAGMLMSGIFVEYWDEDLTTNDAICLGSTIRIDAARFASGGGTVTCTPNGTWGYRLTPR